MSNLRMFIPITKVDAAQRLVYGIATGETVDRSGEVCDYATTKPYYEKWSGDIAKSTEGKSLGNVRAMHGKVAAGKVTSLTFNDGAKQIEICAKVVDDSEWNKVVEGVYTGFSQGGGYVKRWKDEDGNQRYTADPSEVSLVDLPCLPTATFEMVKAAGDVEVKHFATIVAEPTNADVAAKATEMAKAAGKAEASWTEYLDPARAELAKAALPAIPEAPTAAEPEAKPAAPVVDDSVVQKWMAKDGSAYLKKADALAHNATLEAQAVVSASTDAVIGKLDAISANLGIEKTIADESMTPMGAAADAAGAADRTGESTGGGAKAPPKSDPATDGSAKRANKRRMKRAGKAMTAEDLEKGMYTVSSLANAIANLDSIRSSVKYEEMREGDSDSELPAKADALLSQAADLLIAMAIEECDELTADDDDSATPGLSYFYMAAGKMKPDALGALTKFVAGAPTLTKMLPELEKVGSRNSKGDQSKIQAMHDSAVDLGAACGGDAGKAHGHDDLSKAVNALNKATAERDLLQKTIDERIMPALDIIAKRVENIENQPVPLPLQGGNRIVSKGGDAEAKDADRTLEDLIKTDPDAVSRAFIKLAQSQPQPLGVSAR